MKILYSKDGKGLSTSTLLACISQMVTYLICDELRYGFKSAYEQS